MNRDVSSQDTEIQATISSSEREGAGQNPNHLPEHSESKRAFLRGAAAAFVIGAAGRSASGGRRAEPPREKAEPLVAGGTGESARRSERAYNLRVEMARLEKQLPAPSQVSNGDEELYPDKIASYSKGLPHNELGEVNLKAYKSLLHALKSADPADFEKISMGNVRKLVNPQAGLAFELRGPDPQSMAMKPPPAFSSAEEAAEIAENYWMALARDVPFSSYSTDPLTNQAAADLIKFSAFKAPRPKGEFTPNILFRPKAAGALVGPYISQFLYRDPLFGSEQISRKMRTVKPGIDYLTDYAEWLDLQSGNMPWPDQYDPEPRYIRNGRDLGQWVHHDVLFQAYLDALLVLFRMGARLDSGNPYRRSQTQVGFGTLGNPYIASLVCGVATQALKTVWYQKWYVHKRLRPEEFGGRIHNHMTGAASYPIHRDILNSPVLDRVFRKNGTYLLPQAFPEGAPTHPAYGAGHATVAGSCVTILKAFFDESFVLRGPVEASPDGLSLVPYEGPELTVGGELDKLAYNIAIGRNFSGVHWPSDAEESLKLGEEVAIRFLREERHCFNERITGFSLTKFDGSKIII